MSDQRRPLSIVGAALPGAIFGLYQAFRSHPGVEPIRGIDALSLLGSGFCIWGDAVGLRLLASRTPASNGFPA